jgi:hypothetical protein
VPLQLPGSHPLESAAGVTSGLDERGMPGRLLFAGMRCW